MKFDTLTLSLPAHWLPALINCDYTGLDEAEYAALCRWEDDTLREFGHVAYCLPEGDAEAHFVRYHDAAEYGVLACDCYDVTLVFEAPCAEAVA
jgi:hypothetical protein